MSNARFEFNEWMSPTMLILDHLLSQIQLLLSRQIGVHFYLLGLVTPHSLLQPHAHLLLLYELRLADLLHLLLVLLRQIRTWNHLRLLLYQVSNE